MLGNFCANFPNPSRQTINNGMCASTSLGP